MKKRLNALVLMTHMAVPSLFAGDTPPSADLPQVLVIGDSISIGYTPHVVELLKDKAVVKHHKGNAGPTGNGLKNLEKWLGETQWDVIHFNWGLHDLCYRNPEAKTQGHRDKVNGTLTMSLEQYEENLDELVSQLKATGAKLIWAHTTVVPENEAGRKVGDDKKYNEVAAKVMKQHGVTINDLNSLTSEFPPDLFAKPGDVHYTTAGYKKIAEQVAERILNTLEGGKKDVGDRE